MDRLQGPVGKLVGHGKKLISAKSCRQRARDELPLQPQNSPAMGSVLSGRHGYHGGKPQTTELPSVSLVRGKVDIQRPGLPLLMVDGGRATVIHGRSVFTTTVEATLLYLGGERRWLVCPSCGGRRKTLYVANLGLACRVCAGLRYPSQAMNRRARAIARADQIRERLGWGVGVLRSWGVRPSGMHRETFDRLTGDLSAVEGWLIPDLAGWVKRAGASS